MSVNQVVELMRERIAGLEASNRKVVGVFQWKTATSSWVMDLKEFKVYEGVAENPDTTMIAEADVLLQLVNRDATVEELTAKGKLQVSGDLNVMAQAFQKA